MARSVTQEILISAASQFLGTEFNVRPRPQSLLKLLEVNLAMGGESKTWEIRKTSTRDPNNPLTLLQSEASPGVPGANTISDVLASGRDIETVLEPGEQIQIVTSGATADLRAKLYFLDVEPSELV